MLLKRDVLDRIEDGTVSLVFRYWKRPSVRAGGTLRTAVGVLGIQAVDVIEPDDITDADAARAGHASREALLATLDPRRGGHLYRVAVEYAGPDSAPQLRDAEVAARLARLDRASRDGPWTAAVLGLIRDHPGTRAAELAEAMGVERLAFKRRVRRLKELGLTESLKTGYRLSPFGARFIASAADD